MQGNSAVECEILNVIQGAGIWPDCDDKTQLLQAIETLIAGGGSGGGVIAGSEIGAVSAFAMPTPPEGWLVCDGAAISRTEYADLFATIGTLWGHGDQVSTFNLPDLRGEFVRGYDDGRGVDTGRVFGSAQLGNVGEHKHQTHLQWSNEFPNYIYWDHPNGEFGLGDSHQGAIDNWHVGDSQSSVSTQYTLTDNPYTGTDSGQTRPRNIAMTYAIKAFYPTASVGQ